MIHLISDNMSFSVIQAVCRGHKPLDIPCQDAMFIHVTEDWLVVVVADGLGSCPRSHIGAQTLCHVISRCCADLSADIGGWEFLSETIPRFWRERIKSKAQVDDIRDFSSVGGFLCVNTKTCSGVAGRKGDISILAQTDDGSAISVFPQTDKAFLNGTECLCGRDDERLELRPLAFKKTFAFLIATDGVGDELDAEQYDGLFAYLKGKYADVKQRHRDSIFKKEIKHVFGKKNNDDKTVIFGWGT